MKNIILNFLLVLSLTSAGCIAEKENKGDISPAEIVYESKSAGMATVGNWHYTIAVVRKHQYGYTTGVPTATWQALEYNLNDDGVISKESFDLNSSVLSNVDGNTDLFYLAAKKNDEIKIDFFRKISSGKINWKEKTIIISNWGANKINEHTILYKYASEEIDSESNLEYRRMN